jgi:putative MFS transporter
MPDFTITDFTTAPIAARLDRLPPSRTIWTLVFLVSLGGVFEFYDLFLTGYVAPSMMDSGLFTSQSLGIFAGLKALAVAGIGTFVFCTFAGMGVGVVLLTPLADRFGRRTVFTWSLVWYIACTAIMAFQRSGEALNLWRFIAGLGFGVQLVTIDTYITEIIPFAERGRALAFNQFVTFCTVPVVALLAWVMVPYRWAGMEGWRWVILLGSLGAAVVWFLRRHLPESPRWLAVHGRTAEAHAIVAEIERKIIAETGRALPPIRPAAMERAGEGRMIELVSPRYVERTLMLSIFNAAQVIGFYGFAAWVPTLLVARGITITHSLEYSFVIASANPFGPLLAMVFADRVERKSQIMGGLFAMALLMAVFSVVSNLGLLLVIGVLFTVSANVMSYAYHAYQAELFPTRIRARGIGVVYAWSRITAAFAGLIVGYFLHYGGVPAIAVFIGVAMAIGIVIIGVFGPNTTGRPLESVNF